MPTGIYPRTEENKKKIGITVKKLWKNSEYRKRMKKRNKKISEANKGRIFTTEHKKNISLAKSGKSHKPHSEATKQKMSIAGKKRFNIFSEEEAERRFKERKKRGGIKYRQKYPEKIKAEKMANYRIPIPEDKLCEECKLKLAEERHHEDYSKPLEIKFVCICCHNKLHRR